MLPLTKWNWGVFSKMDIPVKLKVTMAKVGTFQTEKSISFCWFLCGSSVPFFVFSCTTDATSSSTLGSKLYARRQFAKTAPPRTLYAPLRPRLSIRIWAIGTKAKIPKPVPAVTSPVANDLRLTKYLAVIRKFTVRQQQAPSPNITLWVRKNSSTLLAKEVRMSPREQNTVPIIAT